MKNIVTVLIDSILACKKQTNSDRCNLFIALTQSNTSIIASITADGNCLPLLQNCQERDVLNKLHDTPKSLLSV